MPKIEANGINVYYELHGPEGADVLVLSNGILMSTASWAFQVPVLAQHYRLLLYDCRGMWQSEHPPGPYSMELHAADLAALLDCMGIERAHIGGVSYGGEVSLAFALQYPHRTRSLFVASAVSHLGPVLKGFAQGWIMAARARDPDLLFTVTYPLNFSEAWIARNGAALNAARERYASLDMDAFLELMDCFCRLDLTSELHHIEARAMVVAGEEDMLKPRQYAEIIAREIPKAELVVVPHAGHAVMWEQPGVFNALVLGFLDRC